MASFLNNHKIRGLRNNNPGNLIKTNIAWQGKIPNGKDAKFEQFVSLEFGIRALALDLTNDIRKGKNTIAKLITEYAPKSENDTKMYIDSVAKSTGINQNTKIESLNGSTLFQLIRAILKVELGSPHTQISDLTIQTALRLIPHSNHTGLNVDTSDSNASFDLKTFVSVLAVFFYSFFSSIL